MTSHELVLGVDGGGSQTRVWLARCDLAGDHQVVGRGTAEASNPRTGPLQRAVANLESAVQAAFAEAGLQRQPVAAACIGLAGADRDEEKQWIRQWADEVQLADLVEVTNDAMPILYANDESGVGVALIAGTGSVAWGRDARGQTSRCGGWGPLMGDEGSGYAIACAGLRAAARYADRRGKPTVILERLQSHFQVNSALQLIPAVYAREYGRAEIAQLSSIVFAAAAEQDSIAKKIVDDAGDELALCVRSVAAELNLPSGQWVLAVTGGLLLNQPLLRQGLADKIAIGPSKPKEWVAVDQPVAGAVRLAVMATRSG